MRPQDVVVLLKITIKGEQAWTMKELSQELEISASELSESLHRSVIAGLRMQNKKQLMRQALMDFLQYGLRYVYPQQPGALVRGIPTCCWSVSHRPRGRVGRARERNLALEELKKRIC